MLVLGGAPHGPTSADDAFSASVVINGNVVVIGAPSRDAAYVFAKSGAAWTNHLKCKEDGNE
jgi:hypothetical protein